MKLAKKQQQYIMSKELSGYLFARVDIDFDTYKQLKEEHEMTLLKVYDKRDKSHYELSEEWKVWNQLMIYAIENKDELEAELRTLNEKK